MRICIVTGTYPPARCGVGDYTGSLSDALAARGFEICVITSAYLGTVRRSGNPTVLPLVKSWSTISAPKALGPILRTQPDIIHFQFPTAEYGPRSPFDLLVPMTRLWCRPARVVVTLHEPLRKSPMPEVFRPYRFWAPVLCADALIVVAESYRDVLHDASGRARRIPCRVIPIAPSIPISCLSLEQRRDLRRQNGLADADMVLSFFGFVHPPKGFEQVLEVLKILRHRGVAAVLVVLGELSDGTAYHRELHRRIAADGLRDHVKVLGYLPPAAVADHLMMSDACVLPFSDGVHVKSASFLAVVEQGVLTITTSTERTGLSETENVYYARPGDVDGMAGAAQQYAGRRLPAGSGQRRTWDQVAREHFEFFTELLRPGAGRSLAEQDLNRVLIGPAAPPEKQGAHLKQETQSRK